VLARTRAAGPAAACCAGAGGSAALPGRLPRVAADARNPSPRAWCRRDPTMCPRTSALLAGFPLYCRKLFASPISSAPSLAMALLPLFTSSRCCAPSWLDGICAALSSPSWSAGCAVSSCGDASQDAIALLVLLSPPECVAQLPQSPPPVDKGAILLGSPSCSSTSSPSCWCTDCTLLLLMVSAPTVSLTLFKASIRWPSAALSLPRYAALAMPCASSERRCPHASCRCAVTVAMLISAVHVCI
jgi:hypothetical protein